MVTELKIHIFSYLENKKYDTWNAVKLKVWTLEPNKALPKKEKPCQMSDDLLLLIYNQTKPQSWSSTAVL